ncbi:MAG: hypothetical protein R2688_05100 [Fimbriimonadaceae bacterium]
MGNLSRVVGKLFFWETILKSYITIILVLLCALCQASYWYEGDLNKEWSNIKTVVLNVEKQRNHTGIEDKRGTQADPNSPSETLWGRK